MISRITGTIIEKKENTLVIDVHGLGYLVSVPANECMGIPPDSEVSLYTYLVVKEDALDLYGSTSQAVIDWFKVLLEVKGVGPKSALNIMSQVTPADLSVAIQTEDAEVLIHLGVGKKSAERIVLELKNKAKALFIESDTATAEHIAADTEALQALEALGYGRDQARKALKEATGKTAEERIREALKMLGR